MKVYEFIQCCPPAPRWSQQVRKARCLLFLILTWQRCCVGGFRYWNQHCPAWDSCRKPPTIQQWWQNRSQKTAPVHHTPIVAKSTISLAACSICRVADKYWQSQVVDLWARFQTRCLFRFPPCLPFPSTLLTKVYLWLQFSVETSFFLFSYKHSLAKTVSWWNILQYTDCVWSGEEKWQL